MTNNKNGGNGQEKCLGRISRASGNIIYARSLRRSLGKELAEEDAFFESHYADAIRLEDDEFVLGELEKLTGLADGTLAEKDVKGYSPGRVKQLRQLMVASRDLTKQIIGLSALYGLTPSPELWATLQEKVVTEYKEIMTFPDEPSTLADFERLTKHCFVLGGRRAEEK